MGSRIDKSINLAQSNIKSTKLNTSQKGVVGEHQCIVDFTKQGYWVAQSCNPQCPFDLVLVSPSGKIELVDIKTNTYRKNVKSYRRKIWRVPTPKQKKLGIKIIMVDHGNKI
jgi:hypothetical protein|tara:strand:+ start:363 stop:698 length:336 start_codon:yes stop_codon:yes gene_type:complete